MRLSRHCDLTFTLDNCRDKLFIVVKNFQLISQVLSSYLSRQCSLPSALCCVMTTLEMPHRLSIIFSRILFNIFCNMVSIVATFLLLFIFSFVMTILRLSQHYMLSTLSKSIAFVALFYFFALNPCKTQI